MKTSFEFLQHYDRNSVDGRVVVWDGKMAAAGISTFIAVSDDGSGSEEDRFVIDSGSVARKWIADRFETRSIHNLLMNAKYVREFFARHKKDKRPVAILDRQLQIAPSLADFVLSPFLKNRGKVLVEMIDFGVTDIESRNAQFGARFTFGDVTALISPVKPVEGDLRILIPDDLDELLNDDLGV